MAGCAIFLCTYAPPILSSQLCHTFHSPLAQLYRPRPARSHEGPLSSQPRSVRYLLAFLIKLLTKKFGKPSPPAATEGGFGAGEAFLGQKWRRTQARRLMVRSFDDKPKRRKNLSREGDLIWVCRLRLSPRIRLRRSAHSSMSFCLRSCWHFHHAASPSLA